MSTQVKICGVRSVADAEAALLAGADEIGLNFVLGRSRAVDLERARELLALTSRYPRARWIGVVADADPAWLEELLKLPLSGLQLHGAESPEVLRALLDRGVVAYKAISVASLDDVMSAGRFAGERVLFDTGTGGSGRRFDWSWLSHAALDRPYWLAGGLDEHNVTLAIASTRAAGVDVASGVEYAHGQKDAEKMRRFIDHARSAFAAR